MIPRFRLAVVRDAFHPRQGVVAELLNTDVVRCLFACWNDMRFPEMRHFTMRDVRDNLA
jgi:hypothetical protein